MSAEAPEAPVLQELEHDGYVVATYEGGPVAGGFIDVAPATLDTHVTRRLVPTERQLLGGDSALTEAIPTFTDKESEIDTASRRARFIGLLRQADPRSIDGPRLPLIVLGLTGVLGGWDTVALNLAQPEIQADFGLSVVGLAKISSVVAFVSTLMGVPLGYMVDRVRRRVWLYRFSAIVNNFSDFAEALSPNATTFIAAGTLGGFASVPGEKVQLPIVADYYPSRSRGQVFAFLSIGQQIGSLISLPIAGLLITVYGWRFSTLALAVLSLGVALLTFFLKEPVRGAVDRLEMGLSPELAAIAPKPPSFQESLRATFAVRTLRLQVFGGFITSIATGPTTLLISLVLAGRFAQTPFQRALVMSLSSGFGLLALVVGGPLADRLLTRKPGTLVAVQAGLGFLSIPMLILEAVAQNVPEFVIPGLVITVTTFLLAPASLTVISLVVPARNRGLGLQFGTPLALIASILSPVLISFAIGGSLQQGLLFFIPFLLIGSLFILASAGSVAGDIRAARAASVALEVSFAATAAGESKVLVCRDLDVGYDDVQVLFNVDLDVREGEILALVGTNGAGKSTLLRAICGLQQASNGAIFFDGDDITNVPTHESAKRGVVYMPGGQGVFPRLTVRANLHAAAWTLRKDDAEVERSIERVLEFFPRLRERIDTEAGALSGGEQQMLAVGGVFLTRPKLLMIDELSLGLAPAIVEQLLGAVRAMRDDGVTVILVEQSLNVAFTIADRAVFMEKGEIQFDGSTDDLLARPDLVRAVFMGGGGGGASTAARRRMTPTEETDGPLLSATGLTVTFGGVTALKDVNISVAAGEVVGIIGPNGAGKTTLFDALSGYQELASGAVLLGDQDVTKLTPDARARLGLGRAFQNARLFPPLTVRENISVAMERRASKSAFLAAIWAPQVRDSERKLRARVEGYIELLGLTAYADKFVRELSTGTRRAVEVACQMAAEPKVLLLDEPSSGLAQAETEQLGPALLRIVKETGCGMVVIEHDLPLITTMSDRMVAMELGQVIAVGTPAEVTTNARVLQSYLAASSDVIERSGSRTARVLDTVTEALGAAVTPTPTDFPAPKIRRTQ